MAAWLGRERPPNWFQATLLGLDIQVHSGTVVRATFGSREHRAESRVVRKPTAQQPHVLDPLLVKLEVFLLLLEHLLDELREVLAVRI